MRSSLSMFRKYRIGYIVSAIIGAAVILPVGMALAGDRTGYRIAVFAASLTWIMGCANFFIGLTKKKLAELMKLYEDCRISEFIKEYRDVVNQGVFGEARDFALINLTAGYTMAGNFEAALGALRSVNPNFSHRPSGISAAAAYYNNLCLYCIEVNDIYGAEQSIRQLGDLLTKPAISSAYEKLIRRSLESKKALLDMRRGNYDGKAVVFRRLFDTAATLAERVSCAYRLAGISRYFGNGDEEKDWLTFVAENGRDTRYAVMARRMLSVAL